MRALSLLASALVLGVFFFQNRPLGGRFSIKLLQTLFGIAGFQLFFCPVRSCEHHLKGHVYWSWETWSYHLAVNHMPLEQAEIPGDSASMLSEVQPGPITVGENSQAQSNEVPSLPAQPIIPMAGVSGGVTSQTDLSRGVDEPHHTSGSFLQRVVSGEATGADCLDLCFRPFRKGRYHDWRSLQFSRGWDSDALIRHLSYEYYCNTIPARVTWWMWLRRMLSFRHLELLQPTSVSTLSFWSA